MAIFSKLRKLVLGSPQNPFNPETFRHIALVAFLAWVGLGADGLSSSCYGPEEAYIALGADTHLALYIALAVAVTVFIISLGYNQVIELFPSGGGGYKVATQLLNPYAGLVSGAALIVDYVLTISVSIASCVDSLFSLLPLWILHYKLEAEILLVVLLIFLNLRGMKESIKILLPIFLGFVTIHIALIIYGISPHLHAMGQLIPDTVHQTQHLAKLVGWGAVSSLLLHSYSLGSSTYTGLEAVSNNVNRLADPRVRTGKWTMFYMAISLSFTAGGIILLYLLWHAAPVAGQTLNAVVFHKILGDSRAGHVLLITTLAFEAGLLLLGANTGFLGGPAVLANMSKDSWLPNRFRHLSSRLVIQNGVIVFGVAAILILLWTRGHISLLAVLYSINVFITFTLSLLGLCVYWARKRSAASARWRWRLVFSIFGFMITCSILFITIYAKFTEGGWVTLLITSAVIVVCIMIKKHYNMVGKKLAELDKQMLPPLKDKVPLAKPLDPQAPTAIFFIGKDRSVNMHTLLWVLRMFPDHFKNFIFLSAGAVDIESFSGQEALEEMKEHVDESLHYFVTYCQQYGLAAAAFSVYGTDVVDQLITLAKKVGDEFPNSIFFATKLIFEHDNWITRMLHNETPMMLQRRLHLQGKQFVILPMKLG